MLYGTLNLPSFISTLSPCLTNDRPDSLNADTGKEYGDEDVEEVGEVQEGSDDLAQVSLF